MTTSQTILRAEIDTNTDPRPIFNGAPIHIHPRQGIVIIEKRADGLYIDGQKVVLFRSKRQVFNNFITVRHWQDRQRNFNIMIDDELRIELEGQTLLSASIKDFLMDNPEFIPEEWKERNEDGGINFVFFLGTIWRDTSGTAYVSFIFWGDGKMISHAIWFAPNTFSQNPVAVLEKYQPQPETESEPEPES